MLQSSANYTGSTETYPQYNTLMLDSLNKAVNHASECANLPQKNHFDFNRYMATKKACQLIKDTASTLISFEQKRQEILLQPHCKDLNKSNCPEYYETHTKINDILVEHTEVVYDIFQSAFQQGS